VKLVRGKGEKLWVTFEINGSKPSPFVGHGKVKKVLTDPQKISGMFMQKYKKIYNHSYGVMSTVEWAVITRMSREFDVEELDIMLDSFFRRTSVTYAHVQNFYGMRNRINKELSYLQQEKIHYGPGEKSKTRGRW